MYTNTENTAQELEGPLDSVAMPLRADFSYREEPGEQVLWQEQPEPAKYLNYFFSSQLGILQLMAPGLILLGFLASEGIWGLFVLLLLLLLYFSAGRLLRWHMTFSRTCYVVTDRRIIFFHWRLFRGVASHVLRYEDFDTAQLIWYEQTVQDLMNNRYIDRWSHIVLMTGKDIGFWTYDLLNQERRFHPTLERLKNAEKVFEIIQNQKLKQKNDLQLQH